MQLLASKNDIVVAESVVVLKQLLQMPREEGISYDEVIKKLTRLFTKVSFFVNSENSIKDGV
jgi:hypothetical protein